MNTVNTASNFKGLSWIRLAVILILLHLAFLLPVNGQSNPTNASSTNQITPGDDPFEHIKQIRAGVLDVGYVEAGPVGGQTVLLIHGWPYDIFSYQKVSEKLTAEGYRVLIPYLRGYGTTRFLSSETPRNGQQSAFALDMIAFMDALHVKDAIVGGFDWGARTANIMAALWPDRVSGMVSVSGYLIGSQQGNKVPLKPTAEQLWLYQFYFATERGASTLSSGEFVGLVADNPEQKIDLKAFHCEIINNHQALKEEQDSYQAIPEIRKIDQSMVLRNYMQVKQDVIDIVEFEIEKIVNDPALENLIVKKV